MASQQLTQSEEQKSFQKEHFLKALLLLAHVTNQKHPKLTINDVGLQKERNEGEFTRVRNIEEVNRGDVYISFKLPPSLSHEEQDELVLAVQQEVSAAEGRLRFVVNMTHEALNPLRHFNVSIKGDRLYIDVSPMWDAPWAAVELENAELTRRDFHWLLMAPAIGLLYDGVRRINDPYSDDNSRFIGRMELLGATGITMDAMSMLVQRRDMADEANRRISFANTVCDQLGMQMPQDITEVIEMDRAQSFSR